MGKGTEAVPAPPSRRRTPDRITGRAVLAAAPEAEATAATTAAPTAGAVFYDKGAASAANFRPSYWTYEKASPGDAAQGQAEAAPAETTQAVGLAPVPPAPIEQEPQAATEEGRSEPPAVIGVPPDSATVADELAATIEHVLGSRYTGARTAPESASKPRLMGSAITADSLMAELAAARHARSGSDQAAPAHQSSRARKKASSLLDRAFALGGIALVLFALLALSPWRDTFLSPSISHFFG